MEDIKSHTLEDNSIEVDLNYNTIYNLIYNREYTKAYALVTRDESCGELSRLCKMTGRLIERIDELNNGIYETPLKTIPTKDLFRDFYQALKNRDYEYAYELACTIKNSEEMKIYKILLEDLKKLANYRQKEIKLKKPKIKKLSDKIREISFYPQLTIENIKELIEVLKNKITLEESIGFRSDHDVSLLNLAEMTLFSVEYNFDELDFLAIDCQNIRSEREIFELAIKQGDYITLRKTINNIDWNELKGRRYSYIFLRLAKRMLNIMFKQKHKEILGKESVVLTDEEMLINKKIDFLREIYNLAKQEDYEKIIKKCLTTDVSFDHEYDAEILGNSLLLRSNIKHLTFEELE